MENDNTSNNSSLSHYNKDKEINVISKEMNNNLDNDNDSLKYNIEYNKKELNKTNIAINNINKEQFQKINNEKVNNTLNDIYGSIARINEVNNKVKNLLSRRPNIPKSLDIKRKIINEDKYVNDINSFNRNNIIPKTTKNYSLYNINEKEFRKNDASSTFRTSKKNSEVISNYKKISKNNSYNVNKTNNSSKIPKNSSIYNYEYIKPVHNNEIKVILNPKIEQNINNKISNEFKYNHNFNCSIESTLKSNDITNDDISYFYYNEEIKNEKDIKNMRLRLKKEEKKLKNLEEAKNRLLKEEKIRRNIIMEKIKTKNKIKKQAMIKEYKKKISIIKILQEQNMKDIKRLENNKKIDERKINQINNSINEQNIDFNIDADINQKILKIRKKNRAKKKEKNIRNKNNNLCEVDDELFEIENNYTYSNNINNDNLNKHYTISNNYNNYIINEDLNNNKNSQYKDDNDEKNLIEDFNNIDSLYDKSKSFSKVYNKRKSHSSNIKNNKIPKKVVNNLELYNKNNNTIKDSESKLSLDDYNKSNKKKIKYDDNYSSDSRVYNIKKIDDNINLKMNQKVVTPKSNIPSFIQARVNKYNHSTSKKSSDSKNSKRFSVGQAIPYSLKYNLSHKYKYDNKLPPNISFRINLNHSKNGDKIYAKRTNSKNKELNYKNIFFNID